MLKDLTLSFLEDELSGKIMTMFIRLRPKNIYPSANSKVQKGKGV